MAFNLILSSAPVVFTALIPPSIYNLDLDLSNACWLTSTLALFGALPIVYLLIQHLCRAAGKPLPRKIESPEPASEPHAFLLDRPAVIRY